MKTFFGSTFIRKEKLKEAGINHPIKLEYYKKENDDHITSKTKFGIEIIETEYIPNNLKIRKKNIDDITNDEEKENEILKIFKDSQVTVINSEEILTDLFKGIF